MVAQNLCECRCGYTCGGPGVCGAPLLECLNTHFVRDCGHDFTGDLIEIDFMGGKATTVTCRKCGLPAISHDLRCGP